MAQAVASSSVHTKEQDPQAIVWHPHLLKLEERNGDRFVVAAAFIPRDTYLVQYTGELINNAEASEDSGNAYMFDVHNSEYAANCTTTVSNGRDVWFNDVHLHDPKTNRVKLTKIARLYIHTIDGSTQMDLEQDPHNISKYFNTYANKQEQSEVRAVFEELEVLPAKHQRLWFPSRWVVAIRTTVDVQPNEIIRVDYGRERSDILDISVRRSPPKRLPFAERVISLRQSPIRALKVVRVFMCREKRELFIHHDDLYHLLMGVPPTANVSPEWRAVVRAFNAASLQLYGNSTSNDDSLPVVYVPLLNGGLALAFRLSSVPLLRTVSSGRIRSVLHTAHRLLDDLCKYDIKSALFFTSQIGTLAQPHVAAPVASPAAAAAAVEPSAAVMVDVASSAAPHSSPKAAAQSSRSWVGVDFVDLTSDDSGGTMVRAAHIELD